MRFRSAQLGKLIQRYLCGGVCGGAYGERYEYLVSMEARIVVAENTGFKMLYRLDDGGGYEMKIMRKPAERLERSEQERC